MVIKKTGIAKYIQVKESLQKRILAGELSAGQKLPTERELAAEMEISRNTASAAYRMLEDEGYIVSTQGKGTFVSENTTLPATSRKEQAIDAIDRALDTALRLGFSVQDFMAFAGTRALQYSSAAEKVKVLFVDCNREQTYLFTGAMEKHTQVDIQAVLLEDLPGLKETSLVTKADLVVTTFRHVQEVSGLTGRDDVSAVATAPDLQSLVGIANMSRTEKVGVVSSGRRFWEIFLRAMDKANIPADNFIYYNPETDLDAFIREYKVLIVTPLMDKTVRTHLKTGEAPHIVPFSFEMDAGSVNMLQHKIAELRGKKRQQARRMGS